MDGLDIMKSKTFTYTIFGIILLALVVNIFSVSGQVSRNQGINPAPEQQSQPYSTCNLCDVQDVLEIIENYISNLLTTAGSILISIMSIDNNVAQLPNTTNAILSEVTSIDDNVNNLVNLMNNTGTLSSPLDIYHRDFRIAFITKNTYDGNLGGFSGADAICNSDINRPITSITYRAYLETSSDSSRRWVGTDKLFIISNLNSGYFWKYGTQYIPGSSSITPWSGYGPTTYCMDWTTNSGSILGGYTGGFFVLIDSTGFIIPNSGNYPCNTKNPLLCIEWY